MNFTNKILNEDCLKGMRKLPDDCIDCCVTSPPYWGLRDYGVDGQLGLETTPEEFVEKMVEIFEEVKRVLKPEGTLWLNLGDSYCNNSQSGGSDPTIGERNLGGSKQPKMKIPIGLKPKDLVGIPWMVAFALRSAGWYLRQDIIWAKPNPMPESVTDRCTKSHEYIFLLSKNQKYYYDQASIKQPIKDASIQRLAQDVESQDGSDRVPGKTNGPMKAVVKIPKSASFKREGSKREQPIPNQSKGTHRPDRKEAILSATANKRSVWTVTTKPYSEAHFATFPPDLIVDCIKAGCPEKGIVLDPFMGAGTTALVARKLNRNYVGYELNKDYIKITDKRLYDELGMFT